MKTTQIIVVTLFTLAALMNGCANTDSRSASSSYSRSSYGVIDAIETVHRMDDNSIGAGTVLGGAVGGVLGNQVGDGTGKDLATVAGVVGGAMVGHEMEKKNRQQDTYYVRVRLENGGYQTVTRQNISDLRIGDQVRIENDRVSRY